MRSFKHKGFSLNFILGMYKVLFLTIEVMPQKFLNYLPVTVIGNLLFVSLYTRQFILKTFKKFTTIHHLSTGFTSEKHWYYIIQKAAHDLMEVVSNEKYCDAIFFNYYFDYHNNFPALLKEFKEHLSLFSVIMHMLKCIRSCEKVPGFPTYCKLCSRVQDFTFNCRSSFRNIQVTSSGTTLLRLGSNQICDLDVFVSNADDCFKFFNFKNDYGCHFALFSYPEEIFAAFSSSTMRIYVNFSLKFFCHLDLNIYDERKVRDIIMRQNRFFLARFWHEGNMDFFYEFFDVFDQCNSRYCFRNSYDKGKFRPYYPAAFDATITFINF